RAAKCMLPCDAISGARAQRNRELIVFNGCRFTAELRLEKRDGDAVRLVGGRCRHADEPACDEEPFHVSPFASESAKGEKTLRGTWRNQNSIRVRPNRTEKLGSRCSLPATQPALLASTATYVPYRPRIGRSTRSPAKAPTLPSDVRNC